MVTSVEIGQSYDVPNVSDVELKNVGISTLQFH